ncbi:MAG: AAA family ATPase, partial [Ruminococcus sp.]|nr:AAA family ATPase [Ruminococcus sp.]
MKKNTKKPIVIAVASQKGGVAKTTTAINVAVALGLKGYKLLLIDFDPQESLSNFFGVYGIDTDNNVGDLMYKTINGESYDIADYIIHNEVNNVDIISSENERMKKLDKTDLNSIEGGELVLKRALENNHSALKDYDFIFIDCSASL